MTIWARIKKFFLEDSWFFWIFRDWHKRQVEKAASRLLPKKDSRTPEELSAEEYYQKLIDPSPLDLRSQTFFKFLLDYIFLLYLDGNLTNQDIEQLLRLNNPYEINRYVDRLIRSSELQGTLAEDIMQQQDKGESLDDLYQVILPDYAYDKQKQEVKIKSFADLKQIIQDSAEELEKQQKMIKLAKLQQAQKLQQEKRQKQILANSPEVAEMLGRDSFHSEQQQIDQKAGILWQEIEKLKNRVVVRKAPKADETEKGQALNKTEAEMSPSELIAYKRRVLRKLREDMNKGPGLSIKT